MCSCPSLRTVVADNEFVNASFLATILQKSGFSAEFFGSAQEALAVARSKALRVLVAGDASTRGSGRDCATQVRTLTMNSGQEIDHSYHEDRLLALLQRRQQLAATPSLMPDLEIQILAGWDVVKSCRMVQARQQLNAVLDSPGVQQSIASPSGRQSEELPPNETETVMQQTPAA